MFREWLTQGAIQLVERGWVPDRITRRAIRRLCAQRLTPDDEQRAAGRERFLAEARRGPVAPVPEKANEQHYEVPAEFYEHVLGRHRKYSCCFWEPGVTELDEAEATALRITCERAGIRDGQEVLELGCGWGSLTLWLAEQYPHCRITAVSNSASQRRYIEAEARRRGIDRHLTIVTADMNRFAPQGKFDRVVSVEMFEHMRNHAVLLERIANWLRDDGRLFVHIFCHRNLVYSFQDEGASDWMGRNFFTGGIMPSDDLLHELNEHLQVVEQWRWNGEHYRKTADAWVARLDRNRDRVLPILAQLYGAADARLWFQRWRLLFLAGSELFGYNGGEEWYVSHYLLEHATRHGRRREPMAAPANWEASLSGADS